MLTGHPPYADEIDDVRKVMHAIANNKLPCFPASASFHALGFLKRVYQINPADRPEAHELLQHQFL